MSLNWDCPEQTGMVILFIRNRHLLGSEFQLPGKRLEIHYRDQNLIGIGDLKGDMDQEEVGVGKNHPNTLKCTLLGYFIPPENT